MLKAIIFDMDGVIIDNESVHQEAWKVFCKRRAISLKQEDFKDNINGKTSKDILTYLYNRELGIEELEIDSLEKIDITIELLQNRMEPTQGLRDILEIIYRKKIPMAIATSSRNKFVDFVLSELNIRKYFKIIVTANDIRLGKPNPEIYLTTAKRLRVNPRDCMVFEDSLSGIESAKAAGMKVVGISTTHPRKELSSADLVLKSFKEVNIKKLKELHN